jgi:hypothetical protein
MQDQATKAYLKKKQHDELQELVLEMFHLGSTKTPVKEWIPLNVAASKQPQKAPAIVVDRARPKSGGGEQAEGILQHSELEREILDHDWGAEEGSADGEPH